MSSSQNTLGIVEQAIQEYNNSDTSNTIHSIQDIHYDVQPYCMMTRTGFVEFDPATLRAKLPTCLANNIGRFLRNNVFLQDIKKNRIQVSLERRNGKIYLTQGWTRLRDFYGLAMGGWVTLLYINPLLFHIRVRKLTGLEVNYPEKTPPYRLLLQQRSGESSSNSPVPYFIAPTIFSHKLEKTLTARDIQSGILRLLWSGFCQNAFPNESTELTLIDWLGCSWNCYLNIEDGPQKTCQIYGQWPAICNAHRLAEGMILKLGVTDASNNKVVHFKIAPFIGVRTTLIAPTSSGGHKVFYQSDHHFML